MRIVKNEFIHTISMYHNSLASELVFVLLMLFAIVIGSNVTCAQNYSNQIIPNLTESYPDHQQLRSKGGGIHNRPSSAMCFQMDEESLQLRKFSVSRVMIGKRREVTGFQ